MTAAISEAAWQQQVIDLAHAYQWQHLHVRRSIGKGRQWVTATNVVGWPDLLLWSERQRRVVAAELKSEAGKTTDEQDRVLASLAAAGVETYVWRPSDLDAAHAVLRGGVVTWWTCGRCDQPIDDDPHTDPVTGEDVHDLCCAACHPHLAAVYGVVVECSTDALRDALAAVAGSTPLRYGDGRLTVAGHGGGLTQDQAARGEACARVPAALFDGEAS